MLSKTLNRGSAIILLNFKKGSKEMEMVLKGSNYVLAATCLIASTANAKWKIEKPGNVESG